VHWDVVLTWCVTDSVTPLYSAVWCPSLWPRCERVAVCCIVLQCLIPRTCNFVTVCCNVLSCVAYHLRSLDVSVLQSVAILIRCRNVLQCPSPQPLPECCVHGQRSHGYRLYQTKRCIKVNDWVSHTYAPCIWGPQCSSHWVVCFLPQGKVGGRESREGAGRGGGGGYTHTSCSLCQRAKAYQCVIFEFLFEAPRMQCK